MSKNQILNLLKLKIFYIKKIVERTTIQIQFSDVMSFSRIQLLTSDYVWLLNKPYEKEVTLRRQNPPLKCCQPLQLFTQLYTELDLLLLKIWGLLVKGLQSYRPSNFENGSTSPRFEPWPTGSSGAKAGWQTFF